MGIIAEKVLIYGDFEDIYSLQRIIGSEIMVKVWNEKIRKKPHYERLNAVLDGVIFEGSNFWLELHRRYGTEKEGVEYANKYLSFDYDQLVKIVAGILWKGKPAAIIQELVDQRRYQPGIPEIFEFLHKNNIWTAIQGEVEVMVPDAEKARIIRGYLYSPENGQG